MTNSAQTKLRCDHWPDQAPDARCAGKVVAACDCRRCSSEDPEDRFNACAKHVTDTAGIQERHARVYPGHRLYLRPLA